MEVNMLLTSGMNFNNLSNEGYAAFVLAIIFTIVTIAAFIYYVRHKNLNTIVGIITTLVIPGITVLCWLYVILTMRSFEAGTALLWAFVGALAYMAVAVLVAWIISLAFGGKKEEKVEENKEEAVLLIDAPAETAEEPAEEVAEEPAEEPVEEVAEEPVEEVAEEATEEPVEEPTEEVAEEEEEAAPAVEGVVFTKASKESFAEQLAKLSYEQRVLYEDLLAYAQAKEGTKTMESKSHLMVKVGRLRLIEMKFLRDRLVCKFMAGSSEFKNYSLAEKSVKIKEKPVNIELENENSVAVAKNMVDIVYKNIIESKEEKKDNDVVAPVAEEATEESTTEDNE